MADAALQNATRRRDEIAARINQAQAQIDDWWRELGRIDQFISDWHRFAGGVKTEPETAQEALPVKKTTGNSDKEEVARIARELIKAEGRPILRPELLKRLRERGLIIEGSDPETVLSTMLWRMKDEAKIVHIRRHGYWLMEEEYKPAHYSPELEPLFEVTDDGQSEPAPE